MKISKLSTLLFAAAITVVSSISFAKDDAVNNGDSKSHRGGKGYDRMMARMHDMDANKDGFVDKDEYMKNAEKKWAKMDKSGSGKVSLKEMEERHEKRMEERQERMKEHKSDHNHGDDDTAKE